MATNTQFRRERDILFRVFFLRHDRFLSRASIACAYTTPDNTFEKRKVRKRVVLDTARRLDSEIRYRLHVCRSRVQVQCWSSKLLAVSVNGFSNMNWIFLPREVCAPAWLKRYECAIESTRAQNIDKINPNNICDWRTHAVQCLPTFNRLNGNCSTTEQISLKQRPIIEAGRDVAVL